MALHLLSFSPISGLAGQEVKPLLSRSSCRDFATPHPLMFSSFLGSHSLPALSLLRGPCLFFTVELFLLHALALTVLFSRQGAALALLIFSNHDLMICAHGFVLFRLAKKALALMPTAHFAEAHADCSLAGAEAILSNSAGPVCLSFSAEACAVLQALCWSRQHQLVYNLFSYSKTLALSCFAFLCFFICLVLFGWNYPFSLMLSDCIWSSVTYFFRVMPWPISWPNEIRFLSHLLSHVVSLCLLVFTHLFFRSSGLLSQSFATHQSL